MEKWQLMTTIIVAIFGSAGFWNWLSQRKASNKEILNAVKGLTDRVSTVERRVNELSDDSAKDRAEIARVRFLRFNGELIRGEKHTLEEFTQALDDIDKYNRYCETHPRYPNCKAELAIANIRRCYDRCQETHDFL